MASSAKIDLNKAPLIHNYGAFIGVQIRETWHIELNTSGSYTDDDLSGATITLDVWDEDDVNVVAAQAITASGDNSNEILIEIDATETGSWSEQVYRYRVKVVWPNADDTFANGQTSFLVAGEITVRDEP